MDILCRLYLEVRESSCEKEKSEIDFLLGLFEEIKQNKFGNNCLHFFNNLPSERKKLISHDDFFSLSKNLVKNQILLPLEKKYYSYNEFCTLLEGTIILEKLFQERKMGGGPLSYFLSSHFHFTPFVIFSVIEILMRLIDENESNLLVEHARKGPQNNILAKLEKTKISRYVNILTKKMALSGQRYFGGQYQTLFRDSEELYTLIKTLGNKIQTASEGIPQDEKLFSPPPKNLKLVKAFNILKLSPTTSLVEVKKRYHQLALRYHPDKLVHLKISEDQKEKLGQRFNLIKLAYQYISKNCQIL